jgi:superfamily II DNA helicase RecQ
MPSNGIMVCTCGFGTWIDVPNVTKIIHIGLPRTIEDYYQEIWRGGFHPHDQIEY